MSSSGPYRTIVADPPWEVRKLASPGAAGFGTQTGSLRSVPLEYSTMSVKELKALPVGDMAAGSCHLYIWTINAYIEAAYEIARVWGFVPRTLLTWAKTPMGLGPGGVFSQTTEHILFAARGAVYPTGARQRVDRTCWSWPRGRHSEKPEAFFDIVEQVSPGPYAELFARRARFGWDYPIGDQALGGVAA